MRRLIGVICLVLLFSAMSERTRAQELEQPTPPPVKRHLKVGVTVGYPPFTTLDEKLVDGLSVRIFMRLVEGLPVNYELIPQGDVQEALDRVHRGELDMAVGPISITAARAQKVAFTHSYFDSSMGLLSKITQTSIWHVMGEVLVPGFAVAVAILFALLVGVGLLVWSCERAANADHFPREFVPGVANGLWFAIVTMTTVGYGDRYPQSTGGRALAATWMLVAAIAMSTLTAALASILTAHRLDAPAITSTAMLSGKRAAVVAGTTSAQAARRFQARVALTDSLENAVAMVEKGEADVVVFDHPLLEYYVQHHPQIDLELAATSFQLQSYGLAIRLGDPLLQDLNIKLLELSESGRLEQMRERWMVEQAPSPLDAEP